MESQISDMQMMSLPLPLGQKYAIVQFVEPLMMFRRKLLFNSANLLSPCWPVKGGFLYMNSHAVKSCT